jgi:ribonuclease T1
MWDQSLSQANTAFLPHLGRLFLSTLLLSTILIRCGAQEVGAWEVDDTSESIVQGAVNAASCEEDAAAAVVEEAAEGGSVFGSIAHGARGAFEAAGRKKDAAAAVLDDVAPERPAILVTAGSATRRLVAAAREKGSGVSDAIIDAGSTAWAVFSESELAALLNSTVYWKDYDEMMTDHPGMERTAGPVIEFATGLSPNGEIATRDILINTALLALPAGRLGSVLGKGGKQAVKVGPDVLILVDDVVVAQIKGGSGRVVGAVEGHIDDLGRVVVRKSPPLRLALLQDLPSDVREFVVDLIEAQKSGGTLESGVYFANVGTHLPAQPPGYYREFVVESASSPNSGMQSIVLGENGELYFTEDCGNSFVEISA